MSKKLALIDTETGRVCTVFSTARLRNVEAEIYDISYQGFRNTHPTGRTIAQVEIIINDTNEQIALCELSNGGCIDPIVVDKNNISTVATNNVPAIDIKEKEEFF